MNFIEDLATKRRKLLEGLKANEGDINLQIFQDFYPDDAHFIYELLQNAEDAGATEASFELSRQGCAFVHNGPRHFDEEDIRAITGIFNSTKKNSPDKIGKFGVGFKSVFVYTEAPTVYSKRYSFRISDLVLPEAIPKIEGLGEKTRFELPFNNARKTPNEAFTEVKAGLEALSETTLLFLSNLRCISWTVGNQRGAVLRETHSDVHIEVLKEVASKQVASSHWLRFTASVDELERHNVALAYELAFLGDEKSFNSRKPISKQLKIVPAKQGSVAVFFPAEKEMSGLRFHLHAPFVPELSRASIKKSPANQPLFEQLAKLAASSLHGVKKLGLLSGEFLAVLPNKEDSVPQQYSAIREAVIQEMRERALTPTQRKGHAPARTLLQARATLKDLLSDEDLALLLGRNDNPTWAIAATQRNSNQDRFLSSLGIEDWDVNNFVDLLEKRARVTPYTPMGWVDPAVMKWLGSKTAEWHQLLYAVLHKHVEEQSDVRWLGETKIVRLADGTYTTGNKAYFPDGLSDAGDPFPRVAATILTAGNRKAQQSDARKFLESIGVKEVGEAEQIDLILKERYGEDTEVPLDDVYLSDLRLFITFVEKNPTESGKFAEAFVFKLEHKAFQWGTPAVVYLDSPDKDTGLRFYYEALADDERERYALSNWYRTCGIDIPKVAAFAEAVGCTVMFSEFVMKTTCSGNPKWDYLYQVPGERHTTPINRDYSISEQIQDLLKSKNVDFSRLVWQTMCSLKTSHLLATYQRNEKGGPRYAHSRLVYLLSEAEWIPLGDGRFVAPRDASREGLLNGFTFDAGYKWLEFVHFGENEKQRSSEHVAQAQKRAELGFETDEALERAQAFAKLPVEEQERVLEEHNARKAEPTEEFPARPVRNKDLRRKRVGELADQTPDKQSQMRPRSVAVGYEAAKSEAKLYLREQYTNVNGVMFCQACKAALPFRLPSGEHYFEAVEAVDGLSKRFRETFLAFCPNHAAMFQHANDQKGAIQELVEAADGLEVGVSLAGEAITIHFTETHIADIKACIESADISAPDSL